MKKIVLAQNINLFEILAPEISKKCQPGQFVILNLNEKAERIPVTIAGYNPNEGTLIVVIQETGKSTKELGMLNEGDFIENVVGPLGRPTEIEKFGTAVFVGGGYGTAAAMPIIKALKDKGNYVIAIIGARNKDLLIMEEEARKIADEIYITTDDGSSGEKGFVTSVLKNIIDKGSNQINFTVAIGPVPMMKAVSDLTKPYGIKTIVSLNPIMLDATGMCGVCRCTIDGKTKLACVDGPDFDGHKVDFDELEERRSIYKNEEKICLDKYMEEIRVKNK